MPHEHAQTSSGTVDDLIAPLSSGTVDDLIAPPPTPTPPAATEGAVAPPAASQGASQDPVAALMALIGQPQPPVEVGPNLSIMQKIGLAIGGGFASESTKQNLILPLARQVLDAPNQRREIEEARRQQTIENLKTAVDLERGIVADRRAEAALESEMAARASAEADRRARLAIAQSAEQRAADEAERDVKEAARKAESISQAVGRLNATLPQEKALANQAIRRMNLLGMNGKAEAVQRTLDVYEANLAAALGGETDAVTFNQLENSRSEYRDALNGANDFLDDLSLNAAASESGSNKVAASHVTRLSELNAGIRGAEEALYQFEKLGRPSNPIYKVLPTAGRATKFNAVLTSVRLPIQKALLGTAVSAVESEGATPILPTIDNRDSVVESGLTGIRDMLVRERDELLDILEQTRHDVSDIRATIALQPPPGYRIVAIEGDLDFGVVPPIINAALPFQDDELVSPPSPQQSGGFRRGRRGEGLPTRSGGFDIGPSEGASKYGQKVTINPGKRGSPVKRGGRSGGRRG